MVFIGPAICSFVLRPEDLGGTKDMVKIRIISPVIEIAILDMIRYEFKYNCVFSFKT